MVTIQTINLLHWHGLGLATQSTQSTISASAPPGMSPTLTYRYVFCMINSQSFKAQQLNHQALCDDRTGTVLICGEFDHMVSLTHTVSLLINM